MSISTRHRGTYVYLKQEWLHCSPSHGRCRAGHRRESRVPALRIASPSLATSSTAPPDPSTMARANRRRARDVPPWPTHAAWSGRRTRHTNSSPYQRVRPRSSRKDTSCALAVCDLLTYFATGSLVAVRRPVMHCFGVTCFTAEQSLPSLCDRARTHRCWWYSYRLVPSFAVGCAA